MKDLGYSMNTGVLPVGRLPHALRRDNRYFGERRLSLLVICLENQSNDSGNEHAELKNPFPCNIHTCHPRSFDWGQKKHHPRKNRGKPPTGALLAAPWTAYHTIRQIAREKAWGVLPGRAPFRQIRRMVPSPNPAGRPSGKKEGRKPQNSQKKDCQTGQSMI